MRISIPAISRTPSDLRIESCPDYKDAVRLTIVNISDSDLEWTESISVNLYKLQTSVNAFVHMNKVSGE